MIGERGGAGGRGGRRGNMCQHGPACERNGSRSYFNSLPYQELSAFGT